MVIIFFKVFFIEFFFKVLLKCIVIICMYIYYMYYFDWLNIGYKLWIFIFFIFELEVDEECIDVIKW